MTEVTIVGPGEAEQLRAPAGSYVIRLSGEQTGGALAIVEYIFPAGTIGAAPHIHRDHTEYFHVLDGEITFDLGADPVALGAGGSAVVPADAPHGFRNTSSGSARCLFLITPAGYENYFRDVHRALQAGETLDPDRLMALRAAYATETA